MAIFGERVLATLADGSRCEEFRSAEPSRHVVIDGLFDDAALREVVRDFPAPTRLFRTLVFLTTDYSYHGHPDPLDCQPGVTRKSVALYYYYTNGRPDDEVSPENRSRGGRYVRRPGDRWTPTDLAWAFTPPLL
jgi:hypothetical protein